MNRLLVVTVVGVLSLGGVAHGESVQMKKAVDSCIAETMAYQREGLSDRERQVLETRVKQECKLIVQRECSNTASPLCQHFSGMQLADVDQGFSRNTVHASFRP